ncbi:hypothetical protein SPI_09408 [Niveomyces insectorum RCEF 264]|uniref:Pre-mRNA-splicing factor 38B n=1 Tax=Niveomyces insectorum RCEF 264 TaxID=1081102 RepID=A0A162MAS9_9HYPO|nr:hypothetical protein SPI_09408 [Niveomyces insectorum RCEF 264]
MEDEMDYSLLFDLPSGRNRPSAKMKPNTRFLQHIVREAHSHNAALLARETAESQARLRRLTRQDERRHGGNRSRHRDRDHHDETRRRKRKELAKSARDDDDDDDEDNNMEDDGRRGQKRMARHGTSAATADDDGHRHRSHHRRHHHRTSSQQRHGDADDDDDDDGHGEHRRKTGDKDRRATRHHHQRHHSSKVDKDGDDDERNERCRSSSRRHHQRHRSESASSTEDRRSRSPRSNQGASRTQSPGEHDRHRSKRSSKHSDYRRRSQSPTRDKKSRDGRRDGERSPQLPRGKDDKGAGTKNRAREAHNTPLKGGGTSNPSNRSSVFSAVSASQSNSDPDSNSDSASDSDPLDAFVGPPLPSEAAPAAPPAAWSSGAARIDRHFAPDYDPALDADPPSPTGPTVVRFPGVGTSSTRLDKNAPTVEDARSEMQRDRRQLLRTGAERLRAAGFSDREIAIWARGGKREAADVRYSKPGEEREWDRGKIKGEDGPAVPLWAR